jgi:hypothetical protein
LNSPGSLPESAADIPDSAGDPAGLLSIRGQLVSGKRNSGFRMNTATHSISEWQLVRVRLTRRFFVAAIVQLLAATAIGLGLSSLIGRSPPADRLTLPAAFQFATFFLALGSWFMHRAIGLVKLERQV